MLKGCVFFVDKTFYFTGKPRRVFLINYQCFMWNKIVKNIANSFIKDIYRGICKSFFPIE